MQSLIDLAVSPAAWAALLTLIVMEVVLGIDNLIFISILTNKLPETHRARTRTIGIALALILRLALLSTIAFLVSLTRPILVIFAFEFSWRDIILIAGGVFLIWKSTSEIHENMQPEDGEEDHCGKPASPAGAATLGFASAIVQILVLDMVFSIDSILTAVGMTDQLPIMFVAVIVAVLLMMFASGPLAAFINRNPSVVMLALAFLLVIGVMLIADGFGLHMPRGYIYAAMGFSAFVESLNLIKSKRRRRVAAQPAPPASPDPG
ncbi:MAG: TerC family protein [Caulobacteraceae bacterium]